MTAGEQLVAPGEGRASRCPECGRLSADSRVCSFCGHIMAGSPVVTTATRASVAPPSPSDLFHVPDEAPRLPAPFSQTEPFGLVGRPGSISGRILMVLPTATEPIDPDLWRWVAVPMWCVLLIGSPPVGAMVSLQTGGWLAAALVFLTLATLVRAVLSTNLFWSWQALAALRGRHLVEMMPVVTLRLRVEEDEEVQVRMKGHTEGGAVSVGDRVEVNGIWRSGVLRVRELRCLRTGAILRPVQPSAFPWAVGGLVALCLIAVWFQFSFIPWMESPHISH
jgi:hypothetical protein